MEKSSLINKDMETFRVRMFTNIPPNAVLVGSSMFTKNPKIYSKALFHLPWFQSRLITLETQNLDLAKERFEVGAKGLEVVSDIAVSYKVLPMLNKEKKKISVSDRWRAFKENFKKRPIAQSLKLVTIGAATIASAFVIGPFALSIPAIAAGYVSLGYQDPDYVKKQGAYNAAYNMTSATKELEQIIYSGLRTYYANHTYDEIKGTKIDLNSPEFADLKKELEDYSKDHGVEITRISVKSSDLTPESNSILQKRREAEIKAKSIELEAKAKRRALDEEARGLESIVKVLKDQGLSSSDIAEYLRARALGSSDSKTVVVEKGENGRNLK